MAKLFEILGVGVESYGTYICCKHFEILQEVLEEDQLDVFIGNVAAWHVNEVQGIGSLALQSMHELVNGIVDHSFGVANFLRGCARHLGKGCVAQQCCEEREERRVRDKEKWRAKSGKKQ